MPTHSKHNGNRTGLKPTPQDFQFTNLTNDSPHVNEDDRFLIREVVMTDYHRRKRYRASRVSERAGDEDRGSAGDENPKPGQINWFELQPQRFESPERERRHLFPQHPSADILKPYLSISNRAANHPPKSSQASSMAHILSRHQLEIFPSEKRQPDDSEELPNQALYKSREKATRDLPGRVDLLAVSLDPLINLPSASMPHSQLFIQHYCTSIYLSSLRSGLTNFHREVNDRSRSSLLMIGIRKNWFRASLQDAAFFNAALSHYAASWTLKSREGDPAESLMLRMEAMKIVNKRLDEGEEGISDGTIGAVASMVTYEVFNSSYICLI